MEDLPALTWGNSGGDDNVHSWECGHLQSEHPPDTVNALRANPTLCQNFKEISQFQQTLAEAVADIFRAKTASC